MHFRENIDIAWRIAIIVFSVAIVLWAYACTPEASNPKASWEVRCDSAKTLDSAITSIRHNGGQSWSYVNLRGDSVTVTGACYFVPLKDVE